MTSIVYNRYNQPITKRVHVGQGQPSERLYRNISLAKILKSLLQGHFSLSKLLCSKDVLIEVFRADLETMRRPGKLVTFVLVFLLRSLTQIRFK